MINTCFHGTGKFPIGVVGPGSDLESAFQQTFDHLVGHVDRPAALAEQWARLVLICAASSRADTASSIWQWSAVATADAIRSGRVYCEEVVQAHVDRLRAANPAINAVVVDHKRRRPQGSPARPTNRKVRRCGRSTAYLSRIKINIDVEGQANSNGVVSLSRTTSRLAIPRSPPTCGRRVRSSSA